MGDCRQSEVCGDDGYCSGGDTAAESGGCIVMDGYSASSRWRSKCAEAVDSASCSRFGKGTTTRCVWRSGPNADCSFEPEPTAEPQPNGECVWSGEGRGDPDRMNRKCSRLDSEECGDSRNCQWTQYGVEDEVPLDAQEQNENAVLID